MDDSDGLLNDDPGLLEQEMEDEIPVIQQPKPKKAP